MVAVNTCHMCGRTYKHRTRAQHTLTYTCTAAPLPLQIPTTVTQGRELPLNQLTELLRQEVALAGYTEILTW